jgi:hypothetical protein
MEAGLSHVQIQDLGRWTSSSMVLKYEGGDAAARQTAAKGGEDLGCLRPWAVQSVVASSALGIQTPSSVASAWLASTSS